MKLSKKQQLAFFLESAKFAFNQAQSGINTDWWVKKEKLTMISKSIVIDTNGNKKEVKNLGYLLRNWKQVKYFQIISEHMLNPDNDAYLIAYMYNSKRYETGFASKTVLNSFLKRPVFYDLKAIVNGDVKVITKLSNLF